MAIGEALRAGASVFLISFAVAVITTIFTIFIFWITVGASIGDLAAAVKTSASPSLQSKHVTRTEDKDAPPGADEGDRLAPSLAGLAESAGSAILLSWAMGFVALFLVSGWLMPGLCRWSFPEKA